MAHEPVNPPPPAGAPAPAPAAGPGHRGEKLYDAKFGIEAIQHEPCQSGFTWRTVLGAFFVAFVMLPGVIFMGLMIGTDLGTAADWVTIILFVELARRAFVTLKKQELYILHYTVSHLSHAGGGMMLGGGMFAWLVYNRYLRHSEAFANFGITSQVPDWFAPFGDAAFSSSFLSAIWLPAIFVTVAGMVLSKLTQLSLGYLMYKVTVDVEKLPFPMAPVHAEGAIALAEQSQDQRKKGFRQYCFSIGVVCGAVFGLFYVAVPVLSKALLDRPIQLIPIPFLDLTTSFEQFMPTGTIGIALNLGLVFVGFVLPWRVLIGAFVTTIAFQFVVNPYVLYPMGLLSHWKHGKDALETHVANSLDVYLSAGVGTSLAVAVIGFIGVGKAVARYRRQKASGQASDGGFDIARLWQRDRDRGDPPTWVALATWLGSAVGFVVLSYLLVNCTFDQGWTRPHLLPPAERFNVLWLIAFAFVWTPLNSYINARMSGIAGTHAGVPFLLESSIFISGYKKVNIWFAPLPLHNYGGMADLLRVCQLTRTRFTSILKAELLIFPLMLLASLIFWTYILSLGPIPSDTYPYAQKFWPYHAQFKALWAAGMQDQSSLLLEAIKPMVIVGAFAVALLLFGVFSLLGVSAQYIYGGLGSINAYPHTVVMTFAGACLGRYILSRKFGKEAWQNYAPILAVGFTAGMGLVGMFSIAVYFLTVSIGSGY